MQMQGLTERKFCMQGLAVNKNKKMNALNVKCINDKVNMSVKVSSTLQHHFDDKKGEIGYKI
jgi:hypothetical protein